MDRLVFGLIVATVIAVVLPWLLAKVTAADLVVVVLVAGAGLFGRHLRGTVAEVGGAPPRHSWAASAAWGWRWEVGLALLGGLLFHLGAVFVAGTAERLDGRWRTGHRSPGWGLTPTNRPQPAHVGKPRSTETAGPTRTLIGAAAPLTPTEMVGRREQLR